MRCACQSYVNWCVSTPSCGMLRENGKMWVQYGRPRGFQFMEITRNSVSGEFTKCQIRRTRGFPHRRSHGFPCRGNIRHANFGNRTDLYLGDRTDFRFQRTHEMSTWENARFQMKPRGRPVMGRIGWNGEVGQPPPPRPHDII